MKQLFVELKRQCINLIIFVECIIPMKFFMKVINRYFRLKVKFIQLCPTLCDPMDCIVEFSRSEYWSGQHFPSPGDLPNPGMEPRSPTLRADSLPIEPPGKSKETGVGSLSILQWIFLTQESNWGLLHCRWILYQLNYQGVSSQ